MKRRNLLEFDRDRKSSGVLYHDEELGKNQLFVKGAPENVLERCTKILLSDGSVEELTAAWKKIVLQEVDGMAKKALRNIALAMRTDLGPVGLADYTDHTHKRHAYLTKAE